MARTFSATLQGIEGTLVEVEAVKERSLPRITVTGLPGEIVRESVDRVRACLHALGFDVPSSRITIHLGPAEAKKHGSQFDVAIAICVLAVEGMIPRDRLSSVALLGELSLDGRVHRIPAVIGLLEALEKCEEVKTILLPRANAWEANLVGSLKAKGVATLVDVISFLRGQALDAFDVTPPLSTETEPCTTFEDVIGQTAAKRALAISLVGRHHLLMIGPPGVGKSLLASTARSLMPPLPKNEWIDVVKLHSQHPQELPREGNRPYRSPHHSISTAGLLGGGSGIVIPGEVSLAHHGVLFLDELPEFRASAVEGLREPLQSGVIFHHRIGAAMRLPASFTLLAAMNPCPCGYRLSERGRCSCPSDRVMRYQKKVSGPILDRIDLGALLLSPRRGEKPSRTPNLLPALEIQLRRNGGKQNGDLPVRLDSETFRLGSQETAWFESLHEEGRLSFRSLHKIVRVARTIADIDESERILLPHLQEARALRCPELGNFLGH